MQFWLDGATARECAEMECEYEDATPSVPSFAHTQSYNSRFNYPSVSVSAPAPPGTTSSVSDAESITTSSVTSSSISTSPSPAPPEPAPINQYYAPVSQYPQGYAHNYYYPQAYAPETMQAYDTSRAYSLHPAQFAPTHHQTTVYYEEQLRPSMEDWLPTEMKHAMQANGMHNGPAEWDGTVTGLSLVD